VSDKLPKAGYPELFKSVIDAGPEGIQVVIFNDNHLARVRAGLSRQKQEYRKVCKFCGDKDQTRGKQFEYTPDPEVPGMYRIRLVEITPTEFVIVGSQGTRLTVQNPDQE
jgi:hypothetical protein